MPFADLLTAVADARASTLHAARVAVASTTIALVLLLAFAACVLLAAP